MCNLSLASAAGIVKADASIAWHRPLCSVAGWSWQILATSTIASAFAQAHYRIGMLNGALCH